LIGTERASRHATSDNAYLGEAHSIAGSSNFSLFFRLPRRHQPGDYNNLAPIWRPDKRGPTREPDKTRAVDADVSAGHSPPPRERIPALDEPKSWVAGARPAAGATNGKRSCRHSLDFCPHPVWVSPRTPDTYSGRRAFKGPPGTATGGRARPGQCHSGSGGGRATGGRW